MVRSRYIAPPDPPLPIWRRNAMIFWRVGVVARVVIAVLLAYIAYRVTF